MRWSPSEEQDELRRTVRRFLEETSPTTEVRRLMETPEGYEPGVWKRLSQELGLPGVHVPEQYGGQGLGFAELAIVLEEMGRALLCAPYFASVALATNAILNAGTESQKAALLPALASGESIATLALTEPSGRWDLGGIELQAQRVADGFTLFGEKSFVPDGLTADRIVVAARRPKTDGREGIGLFHLRGDTAGLERRPLTTLDPTRKLARLGFRGARAEPLGEVGNAAAALEKTLDQAAALLANEMAGGAQRLLEMTVEYAKTRVQFGRPIGSFQAIKHKCADMLMSLELARSSAYYAAGCADESAKELPAVASLAKAQGSDAYLEIAAEAIQIHGGLGFTWEQDVHLYFKRAKASEVFLGDPTYHRELFAQRTGL
ncbi:MAG TPA: acyl-CoA dehydrogenase family protein [Myxococcota bacterium]|nr:acyl-CoA dehydrogenase family protein [Myxococcota bacterium]